MRGSMALPTQCQLKQEPIVRPSANASKGAAGPCLPPAKKTKMRTCQEHKDAHLVNHERRAVFVDLDLARLGVHDVNGRHAAVLDHDSGLLAVVCDAGEF